MKIAILSDTHNDVHAIEQALIILKSERIETIFHCGDMTRAETADLFGDFCIHHVWGNGDIDTLGLQFAIQDCQPGSSTAATYSGLIGEKRIAALHGHDRRLLETLSESGRYEYVFHGHTHRQRSEMFGRTHIINPGALGGGFRSSHSFALLDLKSGSLTFKTIN